MVIMQSRPVADSHTSAGVPMGCIAGQVAWAKPAGSPDREVDVRPRDRVHGLVVQSDRTNRGPGS